MGYTGSLMLGFNYSSWIRNDLQGHIQNFIEANGRGQISKEDLNVAKKLYYKDNLAGFAQVMGDVGRVKPDSYTGKLVDKFDAFTEWNVMNRKYSDNTWIRRFGKLSHINFLNNMAEHTIQGQLMYAVLNTYEVTNKEGKKVKLHSAYEIKEGLLVAKEGYEITPDLEFQVSEKIRDLKKKLQGNYDVRNKAMAQRYVAGQLVMMFRKWMPTGAKRRWRGISSWDDFVNIHKKEKDTQYYNLATGEFEEGIYTTTWRFMRGVVSDFGTMDRDIRNTIMYRWNDLTAQDKGNIIKTVSEMMVATFAFVTAGLAKSALEDEDDPTRKKFLAMYAYTG